MANEFHCDNCGKTGYGTATFNGANPPSGWKTKREGLLKVKNFCSSRCLNEYSGGGSGGDGGGKGGGLIGSLASSSAKRAEAKAAQTVANAEQTLAHAEMAKVNIEIRKYEDEKKEKEQLKREKKADEYKKQGKPFMAWVTLKKGLAITLFFFLIPFFIFLLTVISLHNGLLGIGLGALGPIVFTILYLKESTKK